MILLMFSGSALISPPSLLILLIYIFSIFLVSELEGGLPIYQSEHIFNALKIVMLETFSDLTLGKSDYFLRINFALFIHVITFM